MAISFSDTKGKAAKKSVDSFEYKDGENVVRLVGGVLPRYVYWVKGTNAKDIPIECLAFSREKEKFDNLEVDHVQSYFPDKKCSWSYSINCIDPKDGKIKALNLKKKLFEQIMTAAEDLGDPTDPDTGWNIVFKKQKTGPLAFNVEYSLSVLKCKKSALTDAEKELVATMESIDSKYVRPTSEEVKALCEKLVNNVPEEATSDAETEAARELG
jgi:hypothetical protein